MCGSGEMAAPAVPQTLRKAAFLDRDGVLIRNTIRDGAPYAISVGEKLEIIDGVREACAQLRAAGWLLLMVTNQPDAATGRTPRPFIEEANAYVARELELDGVRVCWHDGTAGCDCRKPKPGMLLSAAAELGIDLASSVMIGDTWKDIDAGKAGGCRTVFIECGYTNQPPIVADHHTTSLHDAVGWLETPSHEP